MFTNYSGFVATNQIAQLAGNDPELGIGEDKVIQGLMYYVRLIFPLFVGSDFALDCLKGHDMLIS